MTNELTETTINVEMETPKIKITNKEKLDALVEAVVNKYSGIIVTEDTLPECKKTLAELRKLNKELNAKRLEKQREYETPVKEFKSQIDAYINQINDVISYRPDLGRCSRDCGEGILIFRPLFGGRKEKQDKGRGRRSHLWPVTSARSAGSYREFPVYQKWGQNPACDISPAVTISKPLLPQQKNRGHTSLLR